MSGAKDLSLTKPEVHAAEPELPVLGLTNCSVDFPTDRGFFRAVSNFSLQVHAGEKVMLLGPSGCGKSTVLNAIGGFLPLATGEIRLNGRVIGRPGPDRILVFQDVNQLFPWRTVRSNISFAARTVLKVSKQEAVRRANEYLKITGLIDFADFYPHALSGGMKQRAAIARAFVVEPKVLLMDEPFGALDAQTRQKLQLELNKLWERTSTSILFVTHSIDEAIRLGHRIVVMARNPGRILTVVDNHELQEVFRRDIEAEPAEATELRRKLRGALHEARGEEVP